MKEYWIVDPKVKTIEVMTLGRAGFESSGVYEKLEALESSLFAGLNIKLSDVF